MRKRLGAYAIFAIAVLALVVAVYGIGASPWSPDTATVTVVDENGTTLGVVHATVADSPQERYQGLSGTSSLENGTGMLFVYPEEGQRAFVMRGMNYPLDMIFVGANGRITAIHHADVPESGDGPTYEARAKWVLEVPQGWAAAHNVSRGDQVEIEYT